MSMTICWLGQAGFLLQTSQGTICIDPYLTDSLAGGGRFIRLFPAPLPPEDIRADLILSTHDHKDHLDPEGIPRMNHRGVLFGGPTSCLTHFKALGIPTERLLKLDRGESINMLGAKITAVFASHTEDSIGLVIESEGTTLYITGDSLFDEQLFAARELAPDILIACINGKLGNMNYAEAARLARELGVKVAIPCHYALFADNTEDPQLFFKELGTVPHYELTLDVPCTLSHILENAHL